MNSPEVNEVRYPPCDFCGTIPDHHPWHGSGVFEGKDNPHIHACNGCRDKLPDRIALAEAEHRLMLLGQVLGECITAAGITRSDVSLTGPELLLFADDLKEHLTGTAK